MSKRRDELINAIIALERDTTLNFWNSLHERNKLFSILLSDEGWYIDYDTAIGSLSALYLNQITTNRKVLDTFMVRHYSEKLNRIQLFFEDKYNERSKFLNKAFKAHSNKDYELSIPVFLSQTEGIFHELTQKEIFSKGRGKFRENTAKNWIDSKPPSPHDVRLAILESLKFNSNLSASFEEAKDFPNALNRNRILHGRDLSYNNELNSLKAISLLLFVGSVVHDVASGDSNISWV